MLIPLPGGHFADPRAVAAVVTAYSPTERGHTVTLVVDQTPVSLGLCVDASRARDVAAEVALAINAALAPKGVEEVPADKKAMALESLRQVSDALVAYPRHTLNDPFGDKKAGMVACLDNVITLLESTPPTS